MESSLRAFVFPGQGSQSVGMGRALAGSFSEAAHVFEEIDDALNQKLSHLMFEGPEAELGMTENTQPALMAVSMAVVRVLEKQGGVTPGKYCAFVAGHSLGEYSALAAAGAFDIATCARLLRLRGRAMQEAAPAGTGAMAAILGLEIDDVQALVDEISPQGLCQIANDNSPGQVVIVGARAAVDAALALAAKKGAKKSILLPVSVPAHSAMMEPAARAMQDALAATTLKTPAPPVVANVSAQAVSDPDLIRDFLVRQVTGRVRWRESVTWMRAQGVGSMTEIGAGKVLCGLIRRIDKDIATTSVETPEQVDAFLKTLK
ncbi:MAG TPA: ACP S-malonyltransferase [Alphaproteobacteria bacterium]|nr:ACP S-malonyltransferase [Alphaproteobacteria bacterium]